MLQNKIECSNCGNSNDSNFALSRFSFDNVCQNCGLVLDNQAITNEYLEFQHHNMDSMYAMLQFMDDVQFVDEKTLKKYDHMVHFDKILRWIEGSHNGNIPDDLYNFVKSKAVKTVRGKTKICRNIKKYRQWFKQYPGGEKHYNSVVYVMNSLQGYSFQFHPYFVRDLKILYNEFYIQYHKLEYKGKNTKKTPPVNFLCIQFALLLDSRWELPYNIWDFMQAFRNLKGKPKKKNLEIFEVVSNAMNFDLLEFSSGYVTKQTQSK